MSGKTYTKGPWLAKATYKGFPSILCPRTGFGNDENNINDYGAVMVLSVGDHTEPTAHGNEWENARLIAAAPDMLEALQGLLLMLGSNTEDDLDYMQGEIEAAQAAVNKALGVDSND